MQLNLNILKKQRKEKISITLDQELNQFLSELAKENKTNKSKVIQVLLTELYNKANDQKEV
jgi:metal-responsive CopG/Arc/MetJ family transcriptional regulator